MGRSPCCSDDANVKKGPWMPEEDQKLIDYINKHGHGRWTTLPKLAGLNRCGKSCRLRWANYLRPDLKRGKFSEDEERIIINLHSVLGNKWSKIATHLPGRTDNEIKNFWNTHIRKKLLNMGIDPNSHKPRTDLNHLLILSQLICATKLGNLMNPNRDVNNTHDNFKVQADAGAAAQLAQIQLLQNLQIMMQTLNTNTVLSSNVLSSGLMGFQNSFRIFEGVANGTNSVYDNEGAAPVLENFQTDGSSMSQTSSDNSWACFEGEIFKNESPDMIDKSSIVQCSAMSADNAIFQQAWEKLMDDETDDGSCWKDILDLTSWPSSPIEW